MGRKLRILDYDTENRPAFYWYDGVTTDLLMCVSWAWLDEGEVTSILLKYSPVRGLHMPSLLPFYRALGEADIVTGHNIRRHDIPLLNAHAVREGDDKIVWPEVRDTLDRELWGGATKGLSRSQANMSDMFNLETSKMTVNIPTWERAAAGQVEALQLIKSRCESDVLGHIELYKELTGHGGG